MESNQKVSGNELSYAISANILFTVGLYLTAIADGNPLNLIFGAIACLGYLIFSLIFIRIIFSFHQHPTRKVAHRYWRYASYALPAAAILILPHLVPQKPNQRDPLKSPSRQYILKMPIEKGLWRLTIYNRHGQQEYKDDSKFIGALNVYWCWDAQDRVSLYNSDTGCEYYWEKNGDKWQRMMWTHDNEADSTSTLKPPEELYPDYVKKQRQGR